MLNSMYEQWEWALELQMLTPEAFDKFTTNEFDCVDEILNELKNEIHAAD